MRVTFRVNEKSFTTSPFFLFVATQNNSAVVVLHVDIYILIY